MRLMGRAKRRQCSAGNSKDAQCESYELLGGVASAAAKTSLALRRSGIALRSREAKEQRGGKVRISAQREGGEKRGGTVPCKGKARPGQLCGGVEKRGIDTKRRCGQWLYIATE